MYRFLVAIPLSLLVACDGDDAVGDAGTADSSISFDAAGLDVTPPEPPESVLITPCPEGWSEVTGDVTTCEPWPLGEPPSCAAHEARFVGDPACARVGTECPADGWPADLPSAGDVRYVREGGSGVGTRDDPFGTLGEALVGASATTVVALAVGNHDAAVDLPDGVSVVGACVEGTVVTSDVASLDHGVFTVTGADVEIRNLRISASERGGIIMAGEGRSATVRDVVIADMRPVGIDVEFGATLDAENVAIRRVSTTTTGQFGRGITVENGATANLRRVDVEDTVEFGIIALEATVTLEDVWVARTEALPTGVAGPGVVAWRSGSVSGQRVVIDESTDVGLGGNAGDIDLELALIRGTRSRPMEMDHGRGINVEVGTQLDCRRCVVEDNGEFGIFIDGDGTVVTLSHLVVRRTHTVLDGTFGRGITLQNAAEVDVSHALLVDNGEVGVLAGGPVPAHAVLSDITILRMQEAPRTHIGRAFSVQNGSQIRVDRGLLTDLRESAVLVGDPGSKITLNDLRIEDVAPVEATIAGGRGIVVQQGGAAELNRVAIARVNELGVSALQDAASVTASDLVIDHVAELACETGVFCENAPGGHGVAAYATATVSLTRFRLIAAQICGVHVAADGTLHLSQGQVSGSAIGACVQSDAQSLADLQDEVAYIDNGRSLDSTSLPVPEPLSRPMDPM